jgi:hypothetical protein
LRSAFHAFHQILSRYKISGWGSLPRIGMVGLNGCQSGMLWGRMRRNIVSLTIPEAFFVATQQE